MRSVVLVVLLVAATVPAADDADRQRTLDQRAARPPDPPAARPDLEAVTPGRLLFSMTAPDNAVCIRGVNDVTGDGRPEIMVGIDESGVDNVLCLDGASVGTAAVVWSHQTATGVSGGSPYGDQSVEIAADADGNGYENVLVGTAWGGRTAYSFDSLDGAVLWKFDTYLEPESGWVYSLAGIGDVTGDGVPDAAFGAGSFNDTLYVVDGSSSGGLASQATVVWSSWVGDAVSGVRDLGDVDGDGRHDVLAAVGEDVDVLYCFSGGSSPPGGDVLWSYPPGASVYACGVLPDVTGDGVDEALAVLWTTGGSAVRCRNGATGSEVWTSTAVADYGMMVDALADVTGDGRAEVVVSSWENAVIVLSGADGSQVWKTTVGTLNGGDVWTARAIGDLDGDGLEEVIAGSFDYHVYALSGADGSILWSYDTGNRVFSVAPVGDLDGDGRSEVGAATQDTTSSVVVYVLRGDPPLFADGFESGGTGAWTLAEP